MANPQQEPGKKERLSMKSWNFSNDISKDKEKCLCKFIATQPITSKFSDFRQHMFIIMEFLWVGTLGAAGLSGSDPRSLVRWRSRCRPGLPSSKDSTRAGGSASKLAVGRRPQSSPHWALRKSAECPDHMAAGLPPEGKSVKECVNISFKAPQCPMQGGVSTNCFLPPFTPVQLGP